jgi:hypothetical protein
MIQNSIDETSADVLEVLLRETPLIVSSEKTLTLEASCDKFDLGVDWRDWQARLKSQLTLERQGSLPIVGVIGGINAGKSSLVRSFLSDGGRERILTGFSTQEATQRFIFWLPAGWETGPLREQIESLVANRFEKAGEVLSADPEEAQRQYNDGGSIHIPLLAFDKALDDLNFGLLDCPDIQRVDIHGKSLIQEEDEGIGRWVNLERLNLVKMGSELCAAFLLVTEISNFATKTFKAFLEEIQRHIPGRTIYLLINRIPTSFPLQDLMEEAKAWRDTANIADCFVAYDFNYSGYRESLPAELTKEVDSSNQAPLFFSLPVDDSGIKTLRVLPSSLEAAHAFANHQKLSHAGLKAPILALHEKLAAEVDHNRDRQKKMVKAIEGSILQLMLEKKNGEDKVGAPVFIVAGLMAESMARTAPRWLRPVLQMKLKSFQALKDIQSMQKWLTQIGRPKDLANDVTKQFKATKIGPEKLTTLLGNCPELPEIEKEKLLNLSKEVFSAWVAQFPLIAERTNQKALDREMSNYWANLSFGKKMLTFAGGLSTIAGSLVAVLGIGATFFIDGGVSAIAIGSGIAALVGLGSLSMVEAGLETQVRRDSLSALLRLSLDAFNLPPGEEERQITMGKVKETVNPGAMPGLEKPILDLGLRNEWSLNPDFKKTLLAHFAKITR